MADIKKTSNLAIGNSILDLVDDEARELIAGIESNVDDAVAQLEARVDNLITTYEANGGTKRTETVLFESSTPSQGNVPADSGYFDIEDSIDNYDYVEVYYSAFNRHNLIRVKPSDVPVAGETGANPVVWSAESIPDVSSLNHALVRTATFVMYKFDDEDRLSIEFWLRGWNGSAASDSDFSDPTTATWKIGILKIVGIKYEDASSIKDPELADIRTGADGTTYASAGDAVRGQISDLKSNFNYKADLPLEEENILYTPELSKLINGSGIITALATTDNKWRVTGYIAVNGGEKYQITAKATDNHSYYAFYDNSYNVVFNQKASGGGSPNIFDGIVTVPYSASYMCVAYYVNPTDNDVEIKRLSPKSVNLEAVLALDGNFEYKTIPVECTLTLDRYINRTTGSISTIGNTKWAITNNIAVQEGEEYIINATMSYNNGVIAVYNSSDNLVDIISSSKGEMISSNTYKFDNYYYKIPQTATRMVVGVYTDYSYSVKKVNGYSIIAKTYPWTGKKWTCVGDSLTNGDVRTSKYYYNYVSENTGIIPYNMGDSGSGYAKEQELGTAFYQRISSVPLDSDVITIFGSFNDLSAGLPLGNKTDTGTTTLAGCINTTIDNLFTAFPLANLGIVTPTPWKYSNSNPLAEPNDGSNYVQMLIDICKMRGIHCLDLFHCSGLRPWEASYRTLIYTKDDDNGVHPDENGHKLIAPRFKAFLETLLL